MGQLSQLESFVSETIKVYPQHKEEIENLFQLCLDEIEDGGSVDNECNLCRGDIEEIVNGL